MNPATCQQALEGVGAGVAASLRAVDCAAGATAQAAFGRLFGSDGALLPALTILLTLYVAFFAFGLITGRSRIAVAALTPRMITVGLVLTFATSWIAYQGVVWNLAVGAPDQIAGILMGTSGSATTIFADKIDIVLGRLVAASGNGIAPTSTYSPLGLSWLGGTLILLGTVGVLVTAKIAVAILLALGPIFVVLGLFSGTRGLFVGWLKGLVLLALAPLLAVLGGSLILKLAVPVLSSLAPTMPGQIDPQAAMAFFVLGAVHAALMILALKVATSMVASWTVFGLAVDDRRDGGKAASDIPTRAVGQVSVSTAPATPTGTMAASRQIRLGSAAPAAANDAGSAGLGSVHRDTRFVSRGAAAAASPPSAPSPSRARGIGSRFRAPVRSMEKFK